MWTKIVDGGFVTSPNKQGTMRAQSQAAANPIGT